VFRDAGAPLTAGAGCTAGAAGEVVCTGDFGDFANSVDVYARDGDDVVDAGAVALRGFTVFVDAGDGSDVVTGSRTRVNALFGDFTNAEVGADMLTGGSRSDFLQGGPGADAIDGGGGADMATYRDERRRVRADLAAGFALTADGARDVLRSIEDLWGGDGSDVLRGNAAGNMLTGGRGDDELTGRAGHDDLRADEGADHLDGGLGGDVLDAGLGRDRLDGGPGDDVLHGGPAVDVYFGGPGKDDLRSADRRAETVACGPQRDRAIADRRDRTSACEVVVR
jgi:Ca2+-binding RTX toxin-like protein